MLLVGHSYGGMVITGAADRAHERVGALVYLDAANPVNGQSLVDVAGPVIEMTRAARAGGCGKPNSSYCLPRGPEPSTG